MHAVRLWLAGFVGGALVVSLALLAHPVQIADLLPPGLEPVAADPFAAQRAAASDTCHEPHPERFHDVTPDCSVTRDHFEAGPVTYRWNACRIRSEHPCTPRAPGTLRILAVGDSTTMGALAPVEDTWPASLEQELTERTGRRVEVLNRGVAGYDFHQATLLALEAAAHDAQVVVLAVSPNDLLAELSPAHLRHWEEEAAGFAAAGGMPAQRLGFRLTVLDEIRRIARSSRPSLALQQLLFRSDRIYVELYRRRGAAWLARPEEPEWRARIADAERLVSAVARRLEAEGRRLVLLVVPQRVQALLVSTAPSPGLDPHAFGSSMRAIGVRHGIQVVDALDMLSAHPRPRDLYHPLDGHLVPHGYRLLGAHLADLLIPRKDGAGLRSEAGF